MCIYNLRWSWVKELRDGEKVRAVKVDTAKNVADMLTKCQEWYQMKVLLEVMGYVGEKSYVRFGSGLPVL